MAIPSRVADEAYAAVAAADALFEDPFVDPSFEPDTPTSAEAAVERFGERFAGVPGVIAAALDGARAGALVLSGDRLQGLAEIVQNADDAGAEGVRFRLEQDALLVAHNGHPITLREVLALATPWLTTKSADASATGRFGIGLMTLHALSRTLEIYSGPYRIRLGDPTIASIAAADLPVGFVRSGDTVLRVPLEPGVLNASDVDQWITRWDEAALLFCAHVSNISVSVGDGPASTLQLRWEELPPAAAEIGGGELTVRCRRAYAPDNRSWTVHTVDAVPPRGLRRGRKAVGATMPVGVALPLHHGERGHLYAGLPLVPTRSPVRVNAQFDPLTSRQGLAPNEWNTALFPLIADLWVAAVLDLFKADPSAGWRVVPLPEPDGHSTNRTEANLEALLVTRARSVLAERINFLVAGDVRLLSELAVEAPPLEDILSNDEIAALAGLTATLPAHVRDASRRWRAVLDDWRAAGASLHAPVSVEAALRLFDDDARSAEATVALAATAIEEGLADRLTGLRCVVTEEGVHLRPPTTTDPWMLVTSDAGLAGDLGIGRRIHHAYLTDRKDGRQVLSWLEARSAVGKAVDPPDVLRRLAAAGEAGHGLTNPLSDAQLRAVRDAFEALSLAERAPLGPSVGRAITIGAYRLGKRGKRVLTTACPAETYLPRPIDKESDSFAIAAGGATGLSWLPGRYAGVLKSALGRSGLGAQRFLRLLGAETAPRVVAHPGLERRYSNDRRRGLPAGIPGSPPGRSRALADLDATYTLEDLHSPDLVTVLTDIGRDRKATRRRQRAAAILAALGRAWDRLGDVAEVTVAADFHGWQLKGSVRAFWVWQAATIPWLDDDSGVPTAPAELRLRTSSTVAVHGPAAPGYLHKDLHGQRHDVLAALGVTGEPSTTDLVERLRLLRDDPPDSETVAADSAVIYQALADRLAGHAHIPGDLSLPALRQAFAEGKGLIRTDVGWRPPAKVLSGKPVFGDRRPFTPAVPGTARLWSTLHIRPPSLDDCITVLSELGRTRSVPDVADQTVILESLRLLAEFLDNGSQETGSLGRLAKLPLWTSQGWTSSRPIYAIDDPSLAEGLGTEVPVWQPGGELVQFRSLFNALRLTELSSEAATVVDAEQSEPDEGATQLLRAAVPLLREDLARNEPATETALEIGWDHLAAFEVRVATGLRVRVDGTAAGRRVIVAVAAKANRDASVLYLNDGSLLARVDGGGRAVAALFAADRRRVAQAWLAACDNARAGREALHLRLAAERAAEQEAQNAADIAVRLATFRRQTEAAHAHRRSAGRSSALRPASPTTSGFQSQAAGQGIAPAPSARALVDPSRLRVADPRGRLAGPQPDAGSPTGGRSMPGTKDLPAPKPGGAAPHGTGPPRGYTDLSKEEVGLELVRKVLASDLEEMRDLRAQHGVGADAVDILERFFELKVYAGAEPDRITLEESQIRRAMSTPDFFLVVVSELEGPNASPKVRVIVEPVNQLKMSEASSVSFTGVRASHSVVYDFVPDE